MKKIFNYLLLSLFALTVASCAKDDIGGTATESMAGEWICDIDVYYQDGEYLYSYADYGYAGAFTIDTFNTASNIGTEMYICDGGSFWWFQAKVDINLATETFSVVDSEDLWYGAIVNVTEGKIERDVEGMSPTGAAADTISFKITFSDDYGGADYVFDYDEEDAESCEEYKAYCETYDGVPDYIYHFYGYRYTGFE